MWMGDQQGYYTVKSGYLALQNWKKMLTTPLLLTLIYLLGKNFGLYTQFQDTKC